MGGFEGADLAWDGFTTVAGTAQVDGPGRKDGNGNGGDYRARSSGGSMVIARSLSRSTAEKRFGFAFDFGAAAIGGIAWTSGGVDLGQVVSTAGGNLEIRVGAYPGALQVTSAGVVPTSSPSGERTFGWSLRIRMHRALKVSTSG